MSLDEAALKYYNLSEKYFHSSDFINALTYLKKSVAVSKNFIKLRMVRHYQI